MTLDTLIKYLEELRDKHGGEIKVDVVAECPTLQIEEECVDVAYSPRENRIKILGKTV
jgi:hypothetical protein